MGVVILPLTRIIKYAVAGQAPVTLELRNTPGKKHKPKVVHAYLVYLSQLTQLMLPPETYKSVSCRRCYLAGVAV